MNDRDEDLLLWGGNEGRGAQAVVAPTVVPSETEPGGSGTELSPNWLAINGVLVAVSVVVVAAFGRLPDIVETGWSWMSAAGQTLEALWPGEPLADLPSRAVVATTAPQMAPAAPTLPSVAAPVPLPPAVPQAVSLPPAVAPSIAGSEAALGAGGPAAPKIGQAVSGVIKPVEPKPETHSAPGPTKPEPKPAGKPDPKAAGKLDAKVTAKSEPATKVATVAAAACGELFNRGILTANEAGVRSMTADHAVLKGCVIKPGMPVGDKGEVVESIDPAGKVVRTNRRVLTIVD